MSRKNISYARRYEHSDFGDLLSELQVEKESTVMVEGAAAIVSPSPIVTFSAQKESEERHRIMSNQEIKYLYSKQDNVIHDKHCSCARHIPDKDLLWAEEYASELKPCSECMIQAYVIAGAKDPKEMDKYLAFFEKTKMSTNQIRKIYVENGVKTRISIDAMTVWHKEDTWRIKSLPKKGHVQLYHNNYVVRKNGVRKFTQDFHVQNPACLDTNISYALSIIKNYEYKPEEYALHNSKGNSTEKKKVKQHQAEKTEMPAVPVEELLGDKMTEQTLLQKMNADAVVLERD